MCVIFREVAKKKFKGQPLREKNNLFLNFIFRRPKLEGGGLKASMARPLKKKILIAATLSIFFTKFR